MPYTIPTSYLNDGIESNTNKTQTVTEMMSKEILENAQQLKKKIATTSK